ncbi:protein required for normal CLN1 and CLN2 G1 cyclin expression [Coemansia guatemalensis]|uniref:Protein required for normal CLN1 and CLN2 G1 cyclin expression n=1 Tax=Coemansia guatemalensis TaxID=2761395 RepID=A0A9W8I1W9_9FUNG|nr:protein required for normal CLN1 and CLN2 G1 cyclin expression [Coemansia guatemalensis]
MLLQMATALLTEAERISRTDSCTYLVKGMLAMCKRLPDAAVIQFNNALRVDPLNLVALLGKARALYGRRQFPQALAIYQQILVLRPTSKPDARIGIGMCLYKLGHVDDARRALKRAIAVDSTAAAPHILLANIELNEIKRSVDPHITRAAADPDTLQKSMGESADGLRRAMEHLQRAYELQPDNAAALITLADRLFCKEDLAGARKLAEKAIGTADTMAIQAEAHFQIARSYHAAKQFDLAYESYQKCLAINERHSLARYGLGQMQLQRTGMSSAEATFQRVLERYPKCVEVLRALAYLHARLPNTKAKALEYYEKEMQVISDEATEHARLSGNPVGDVSEWFDDANLFLEAGLLYEATSAKKARKAYAIATNILQRGKGSDAIPELWNNLGALSQQTAENNESISFEYNKAAEKCVNMLAEVRAQQADKKTAHPKGTSEIRRLENMLVTITYNTARFYEHCGLWEKAEELYKGILASIPAYIDARMRLAYIAYFYRGNSEGALLHISQAIEGDAKRASAWLMRGNIELQRKNVQDARRAFEHVLKDISKHDIYALCSLGNYYLAAGKSESMRAANDSNPASATAKKAKDLSHQNYKRALEFFDKCLQLDERCAAAAHGAAIIIAERGFANDARRLFQEVRDAATAGMGSLTLCNPAGDLVFKTPKYGSGTASSTGVEGGPRQMDDTRVACDVLLWSGVNTAHACVEIGNYRQAILAYEACIKRLMDTTAFLNAAGSSVHTDGLVVSALKSEAALQSDTENSDATPTMMSDAERSERKRVERDLRLYLVRAQYIQAKATKDIAIMRVALKEIRDLCAEADIRLPESESKADGQASVDSATKPEGQNAGDAAKPGTDADGDSEMAIADKPANPSSDGKDASAAASEKKPSPRLTPEDSLVLYDLALVEQSVAQLASDLSESQRTLSDIEAAISDLEHSTAAFTFLAEWGKSMQKKRHKLLYSPRLASERAGYGKSLVSKLARKRQDQEDFERQRQENLVQWRKQQQEEESKKREEAERAERERVEREAKMLRETEERNALLREQMATEAKRPTPTKAAETSSSAKDLGISSDKSKPYVDDEDDLSSDDGYQVKRDADTAGAKSESENDPVLGMLRPAARPKDTQQPARGGNRKRLGRGRVRSKPTGGHTDEDSDGLTKGAAPRKRRNVDKTEVPTDHDDPHLDDQQTEPSGKSNSKAVVSDSEGDD